MSAAAPDLRTLQSWMAHVVQHRRNAHTAVRGRKAADLVPTGEVRRGRVVRPNERMAAEDRLQVYNGAYLTRLKEVLEHDHPALAAALGRQAFVDLCIDFVARHPSRHPNLNRFGKELPDFIARRSGMKHRAFHRDLARLGVAMADAFDAPPFEPLDAARLAGLQAGDWERVVFTPNPSVRLVATEYPVNAFYQAHVREEEPAIPARKRSWLAVYRKDFKVWRLQLPRDAFRVLDALCAGRTMGEATALGASLGPRIGQWFGEWAADGLFTAADVRRGDDGPGSSTR